MGDRSRLALIGNQSVHAKRPVDAAPAIAPPIKEREVVAREQRDRDRFNLAGVAFGF